MNLDILRAVLWMIVGLVVRSETRLVHFHQTYPQGNGNELQYNFGYAIDDGAAGLVTDRWEEKRGGVVKGAYSLLEPGGNIRMVDYQVDGGGGFKAVVRTRRPGHFFLSTQEFHKSNQLHSQPSPEHQISQVTKLAAHHNEQQPVNYHAINAEIIGFEKLFGKRIAARKFLPPASVNPQLRRAIPLYNY